MLPTGLEPSAEVPDVETLAVTLRCEFRSAPLLSRTAAEEDEGSSHTKPRPPKGKCCTTGRFPRHSAAYILTMPLCTLRQLGTEWAISFRIGLCSAKGPRLRA